jgi:hypothetical protein
MARSFNEKMEKKRQAEYNRWKAECNPVWHRRNHWLLKYEEDSTWEDSRAYNVELGCDLKGYVVLLKVTLYLIRLSAAVQAAELQIDTAGSI